MTDTRRPLVDRGHRRPRCRADDVLPHEQTMPKPRSDRLDLLRATGSQPLPHLGAVTGRAG